MDIRESLLQKMKKLEKEDVLEIVAKEMGTKPLQFMLKNSYSMLKNAIKNGWFKTKDIYNAIDQFGEKTHLDDTEIDWDNVEIVPNTTKMRFLLTKDIVEALQNLKKGYKETIKDVQEEGNAIDNSVRSEMKKRGLKMSDQEMKTDATLVVNTMSAKENKKKSGKELKKEIENKKTKIAKIAKKVIQRSEEQRKAIKSASSGSSKDSTDKSDKNTSLTKKQANASLSKCKESVKQSLSSKYGSSLKIVASSSDKVKQMATKNLGKNLGKIQENNIIAAKIEFSGKDKDTLLAEKNQKTGYVVKPIKKEDQTLYFLKQKIVDSIRKELKGRGLGKVSYAYYRHWNGDNPKNKPDSIYVFIGIQVKEKVNEATTGASSDYIEDFDDGDQTTILPSPSSTYKSACGMVSMFRANSFRKYLGRKEFFDINNLFANYRGFNKETYDVNGKIYHSFDELLKNASSGSNEEKLVNKIAEGNLRGKCVVLDLLKRNMKGEIKLSKTDVYILKASVFTEEEFSKTGQELEDFVDQSLTAAKQDLGDLQNQMNLSSQSTVAKEIENNTGDAKETANSATQDTIPEEAKESSGLFKAGTWFGWVRLGAKTTGYVLNHGKSLIDKIAAVKIKHQEDKNLFAEARFLIENENLDKEYADSLFSVRFSLDDMKWHATNMDDRKMKIDEQKLIDKFKTSKAWKKFSETAIQRLDEITKDSDSVFLMNSISNMDDDKIEDFGENIKAVINGEADIRKEF